MNIGTTQSSIDYYQEQPRKTMLDHYNPNGNIVKPVARIKRSRSSRKTPTTLLNASVENFRTLVQQYTGCKRANTDIFKMGSKGPINLNFTQGNEEKDNNVNTISIGSNTTSSTGYAYNHNDDYYQETSKLIPQDHHQTFGGSTNNSLNSMVSNISQDMLSVDDYFMGNATFSW